MNYRQFGFLFHNLNSFVTCDTEQKKLAIASIPHDDAIVLAKLSEIAYWEPTANLDTLRFLYLRNSPEEREKSIVGYKTMIEEIESGVIDA